MPGYELFGKEEREAALEIFDESGGVLFAHGFDALRNGRYRVREFEQKFSYSFGAPYALAVSSGSAALKIALVALEIGLGDEVIIPSFTFIATAEAVLEVGAIPVVAEIDETLNLDPQQVTGLLTEKTRAIIVVHMMGCAADIVALEAIARKYGVKLIEDVAQCCGGKINDIPLGRFGDAGCFSFDFGKTITCGEGGMIIFNSNDRFKRAQAFHDHGHSYTETNRAKDPPLFRGFNYRMTEIQAAIGMVQLEKLGLIIQLQKENKNHLKENIKTKDLSFRKIIDESGDIGDSVVAFLGDKIPPRSLRELTEKYNLPTKNIPDALQWHFAGNWQHMLNPYYPEAGELENNWANSRHILQKSVAFPVNCHLTDDYRDRLFAFFDSLNTF